MLELLDVVVVVADVLVGLAGALKLFVLLNSGQTSRPHARSVGQHPPPSDAGHDLNPGEHTSTFVVEVVEVVEGGSVVLGGTAPVLVVTLVDIAVEVTTTTVVTLDVNVDVGGDGGDELVVVLVLEGVGIMTTTAVET